MTKKEYMQLLENITSEAWSSQKKFRVVSQKGIIHRTRLAFAFKVYVVTSGKAVPAASKHTVPKTLLTGGSILTTETAALRLYYSSSEKTLIPGTSPYEGSDLKTQF